MIVIVACMTVTEREGGRHRGDSNNGKRGDEHGRGELTKRGESCKP